MKLLSFSVFLWSSVNFLLVSSDETVNSTNIDNNASSETLQASGKTVGSLSKSDDSVKTSPRFMETEDKPDPLTPEKMQKMREKIQQAMKAKQEEEPEESAEEDEKDEEQKEMEHSIDDNMKATELVMNLKQKIEDKKGSLSSTSASQEEEESKTTKHKKKRTHKKKSKSSAPQSQGLLGLGGLLG